MKKINFEEINIKKIVDITYEPNKIKLDFYGNVIHVNRYSIIQENGSRKEITAGTFFNIIEITNGGTK